MRTASRRFAIGAEVGDAGVAFRVWAPNRKRASVIFENAELGELALDAEEHGYFAGECGPVPPGTRYRFRLDDDRQLYPDPASRYQPEGPHGPSELIDPRGFRWTDDGWKGVTRHGQVIYELHIGTFTAEGTWQAAMARLPALKEIGITLLEVMPVSDFCGEFGWGYDGVCHFAPCRLYGRPDDFRAFVNRAHQLGLGVILDVVYNHFGPDGSYHHAFSAHYLTDRYKTEWGQPLNFDGPHSLPVREFVKENAAYWISEFHLDGLRLDATQNIYDAGTSHILQEITLAAREAAQGRSIFVVAENEPQQVHHVEAIDEGGFGMDALWNDDFHHSALVALTGHNEAYYHDHRGAAQEFISSIKWGYLYQGQYYPWQKKPRGSAALHLEPAAFVTFLENHDQVANSGCGTRPHQLSHPGRWRAMTAPFLLAPGTPMLFQGQEFASTTPFLFFASHHPELAKQVSAGRREFLSQFQSIASATMLKPLPEPNDPETFRRCKFDWDERERNRCALELHKSLLRLRREDPVLARQSADLDGAVLRGDDALLIRMFDTVDGLDRLLLVNLGLDLELSGAPEPLLAPPRGCQWVQCWSSEDPRFGGRGTPPLDFRKPRRLLGNSAVLLCAEGSSER